MHYRRPGTPAPSYRDPNVEVLEEREETTVRLHSGNEYIATEILGVKSRFGEFRIGDVVKGNGGAHLMILGFMYDNYDSELRAHVRSTRSGRLAWRSAISLRHAA